VSRVPHTPDFLWTELEPMNPMRFLLGKPHTRPPVGASIKKSGYLAAFCEMWEMNGSNPETPEEPRRLVS